MHRKFHSVLHNLKSPENVGLIVRQHVAFGGGKVVFVGQEVPWQFRKRSQEFSRKMEKLCELVFLRTDDEFFRWKEEQGVAAIAIEIDARSQALPSYAFPSDVAFIVGNERLGLSASFLERCDSILTIPQFGEVACLNAAASAILAMYEFRRSEAGTKSINGSKFA